MHGERHQAVVVGRTLAVLLVLLAGLGSIVASGTSPGFSSDHNVSACAGRDQVVKVGDTVQLDGRCTVLVDKSGERYLNFTWSLVDRAPASAAVLNNHTAPNPSFVVDREGEYTVRLNASTDGKSDFDEVVITATTTSDNAVPVALAGDTINSTKGSAIALDGSRSYDADGDRITYTWTLANPLSGFTLNNENTATPNFTADAANEYKFSLVVNDGSSDSEPSLITVNVESSNSCPVVYAGPDQRVAITTPVTLDGSGTLDADGDSLDYSWRMIYRPEGSASTLSLANTEHPSFTADVAGTYLIQLKADDGNSRGSCMDFKLDSRDVVMVVASSDNSAPVAVAGSDQTVAEGDTVQLDGSFSSDADGDVLTYLWDFVSLPTGSSATLSNVTIANPSFVADVVGGYTLKLRVTDGAAADTDNMIVISSPAVIGHAPVADAGANQTVAEGAMVVLDGSGSSDADSDPLTYSWTVVDWPGAPDTTNKPVLSDDTAVNPTFVAAVTGNYGIRLVVNDGNQDSAPDVVYVAATSGGACANPLTLLGSLPFDPGGELPTFIEVDVAAGTVQASGYPPSGNAVVQTNPTSVGATTANFLLYDNVNWTLDSRSLAANPVDQSESVWMILQNLNNSNYYKFDMEFTMNQVESTVQIDALSGCNCGVSAAACPP